MRFLRTATAAYARAVTALAATGTVLALAGCGAGGMTLDTIGETTAGAIRDAGSVRFTMTTGDETFEGATTYEGGEVSALHVESTTPGAERDEWIIDGEYWTNEGGGDARRSDAVTPDAFAASWDWAQVQEDLAASATAFEEVGGKDVDGTSTRGYELTADDRTETWWIDEDGRLLAYEFEFAEGTAGGGTLFDYGADSAIAVE
ncbi:hypothetical protein [Microbacterium karelineae]|uniref:hypothetical protein n=1 Tax=Microbacterium karelineae TaxID=2654283 RepID=UPI0018D37D59|nr:hypothetical protein [Microbacterium karelineae]